jgi:hypothetical protein
VLDEFPIATGRTAQIERRAAATARDSGIRSRVRQFFHPYVLAFLALALSVGASGYGYKLSQYFQHAGVSKASPTRMWVDHRDESVAAQAAHHVKLQRIPGLALFALSVPPVPRLSRDHVAITPAPARVAFIISSHIPFRAPPSLHPSLA